MLDVLVFLVGVFLNVIVGLDLQEEGYFFDFIFMDSIVFQSYKFLLLNLIDFNYVLNGIFDKNWVELFGLVVGNMMVICSWKIMVDIDFNWYNDYDIYGWNV